jgi:endonuclease/exonuclease/phosphatase family metal-dependent hydrolase
MESRALTFLSWNLALLERSAQAPPGWQLHDSEAAVRDEVLAVQPDLVLYQELPGLVPFVETHGMVRGNPRSHSGHLATLAVADLLATGPTVATVPGCAILTTFADPRLTVANVHLAPGPGSAAAGERLAQLAAVVEASPTEELVIIGDTNTRADEIPAIEAAGLRAPRPPHPTWDSRRNRFRSDGPAFTAYFTRWFTSPGVEVTAVDVRRSGVERGGGRFQISDHYPVTGTIGFAGNGTTSLV